MHSSAQYYNHESIDSNKHFMFLSFLCVQDKITAMSENRKSGFLNINGFVPVCLRGVILVITNTRPACIILLEVVLQASDSNFFFSVSFVAFMPSTVLE